MRREEKTVYTLNEFLRSDYKGANGIKTGATDYGGADLLRPQQGTVRRL